MKTSRKEKMITFEETRMARMGTAFSLLQQYSEQIVELENKLGLFDLEEDRDREERDREIEITEAFKDFSRLMIISTQQALKEAHLYLLKLQQNLSSASTFREEDEEEEESSTFFSTNSNKKVVDESEHWKLSVHKLLEQIREERGIFHNQRTIFQKEKMKFQKEIAKSNETVSRLYGQIQMEKEKLLSTDRELTKLKEGMELSPTKSRIYESQGSFESQSSQFPSSSSFPNSISPKNLSSISPKSTPSLPPPTVPNGSRRFQFHQMSSLSESSSEHGENKKEEIQFPTHSKSSDSPELTFIYHRDIAAARAEISVLAHELLESGKREEHLIELNLQLKEKLALFHSQPPDWSHSNTPSPAKRFSTSPRNARRGSFSRSMSMSSQQSYSPLNSNPTQLTEKMTAIYSSEIDRLVSELESKHETDLQHAKEMIKDFSEKLNGLYEENNTLRQQVQQLIHANYQLTKESHELGYQKKILECNFEMMSRKAAQFEELYQQIATQSQLFGSSSVSSQGGEIDSKKPRHSAILRALTLDDHDDGVNGLGGDESSNEQKDVSVKPSELLFSLQHDQKNLTVELHEMKKKNSDLLSELQQIKLREENYRDELQRYRSNSNLLVHGGGSPLSSSPVQVLNSKFRKSLSLI